MELRTNVKTWLVSQPMEFVFKMKFPLFQPRALKSKHTSKVTMFIRIYGEQLKVRIEPENCVDKFAVCVEKDKRVVGHLKKGESGKFAKIIFYFLRSDPYSSCITTISGKRCNLKDGEDLQVPCKLDMTGQKKYVNILK